MAPDASERVANTRPLLVNKRATEQPAAVAEEAQGEEEEERADGPTQWRDLFVLGLITLLTLSVNNSLLVALWPYLEKLDPSVHVDFLGGLNSLTKISHALGTICFALFAHTKKTFKWPLVIGRYLSILFCVLYLFIERIPIDYRRYCFLVVFVGQFFAEGSVIVIRSYVPKMSSKKDRAAAFGITSGAIMLAVVAGPLVQLICSALPHFELFTLQVSPFTGPIWITMVINMITLLIITFVFKNPPSSDENAEEDSQKSGLSTFFHEVKHHLSTVDRALVVVCFAMKCIISLSFTAMMTVLPPYVVGLFNSSRETSVLILSLGQAAAGLVSIITAALFIVGKLGRKIPTSYSLPFSLVLYAMLFLWSFPWSFINEKVPVKSDVNPFGCDLTKYSWCNDVHIVSPILWLVFACPLIGMAIPISFISFDTLYSYVLGDADQNLMQGALIVVDDMVMAAPPLFALTFFSSFGPSYYWLGSAAIAGIGLILWSTVHKRVRQSGL